jgi:hypothetical protein
MIAIPALIAVYVVHEPVSFACGIDGMRGVCVQILKRPNRKWIFFLYE